ncbi:MAG: hypothetical protein JSR99_10125 [Proteobacteria bacterium]|nr:hypothetical protein [Pseudomonadota bacterium]
MPDVPVLVPFAAAALDPDFVGAALLSDGIVELSRPGAFMPGAFDDPLSAPKAAGETASMMADARMTVLIAFPFRFFLNLETGAIGVGSAAFYGELRFEVCRSLKKIW